MCTYRFFISCCLGLVEEGSVSLKLLLGELPGDWLMIVVSLITRNTTETDIKPCFHSRWYKIRNYSQEYDISMDPSNIKISERLKDKCWVFELDDSMTNIIQ